MGVWRRRKTGRASKAKSSRGGPVVRIPVAHTYYKLKSHNPKDKEELGECDFGTKTISVNSKLTDYGQWCATFWHEWLHGTFHENGYMSCSDSESLVESTAQALMRMFSDRQARQLLKDMLTHLEPK